MKTLLPSSSLGVLGTGQLGRMFAQEAIRMGYRVHCFGPESEPPASLVGAIHHKGDYTDFTKLDAFLSKIQALTFEFENIPEATLKHLEAKKNTCFPQPHSIAISQNRILEKSFLRSIHLPTVGYFPIQSPDDITDKMSFPAILKTAKFGYDGKGQFKIQSKEELKSILDTEWKKEKSTSFVLETISHFDHEISVILGRFSDGSVFSYPASLNVHKNHILDRTIHPAPLSPSILEKADRYAKILVEGLRYVGVMGVEFFVEGEEILINEFAPRPHNSGHFSQISGPISQFELQVRILAELPFSSAQAPKPAVMKNVLGQDYIQLLDNMPELLSDSRYQLHLYQKEEAKLGRKMGHINFLGKPDDANFLLGD